MFTAGQSRKFLRNALRDLKIAKEDRIPEVRFTYAYQALIKAGIALLAKKESLKVRSAPGHHIATLSKMSEILEDDTVNIVGNRMRVKRNKDLYGGGDVVTRKEAEECLEFVENMIKKIGEVFKR